MMLPPWVFAPAVKAAVVAVLCAAAFVAGVKVTGAHYRPRLEAAKATAAEYRTAYEATAASLATQSQAIEQLAKDADRHRTAAAEAMRQYRDAGARADQLAARYRALINNPARPTDCAAAAAIVREGLK